MKKAAVACRLRGVIMYNSFMIKYGEIGIKGDNRHLFEDALAKRIRTLLKRIDGEFEVTKIRGRIYVNCGGDWNYDETIDVLRHVFGVVGICPDPVCPRGASELHADLQGQSAPRRQGVPAHLHGGGSGARRGYPREFP